MWQVRILCQDCHAACVIPTITKGGKPSGSVFNYKDRPVLARDQHLQALLQGLASMEESNSRAAQPFHVFGQKPEGSNLWLLEQKLPGSCSAV